MFGSRFSRYTRKYPRKWTTTNRRIPFRRNRGIRGGQIYHLTTLPVGTAFDTPKTAYSLYFPIINNAYFADEQYRSVVTENRWEYRDQPIYFAGGYFDLCIWAVNAETSALKYLPCAFAFEVLNELSTTGQAAPDEIYPGDYHNLFLRDWGTYDQYTGLETDDNWADEPKNRPPRTLFRRHTLQDCGQLNATGADGEHFGNGWRKNYACRVKPARMTRNQGLWFHVDAYNTGAESTTLGIMLGGHFGYRRIDSLGR